MENLLEKIKKQLNLMSEKEKETWILEQVKILPEWQQEDFYRSIC